MVTLVILDGFGESKQTFGNAIKSQGTPHLDKLKKLYPHTLLEASGEAVGLPKGIMGGSEVGHLTMGTGRINLQDLKLIDSEIENGNFFKNPSLIKALTHAEKNQSNLHIMGLTSNEGVHGNIDHMFAILDFAKNFDIPNIYIHLITDGRDCGVKDSLKFVAEIEEKIAGTNAKIASAIGRVYAMDRDRRFDRTEKAYRLLYEAKGEKSNTAKEAIMKSHEDGIFDEFMEPAIIDENSTIKDGDSFILYNFRADRAREITYAMTDENFKEFETKKINNFLYTAMCQYSDELEKVNTLYRPTKVEDNLSSILEKNDKKQFRVAETTKYAHITFFFNGEIEPPYNGEERKLIESINVKDFSGHPKMRAFEITEAALEAIASTKYDFVLINYSNPDMVGHTGNFQATKEAIECVEKQAYAVALATLMAGGDCIITADHGNAELMIDKNGNKVTSHTTNPVPFILVSEKHKKAKLKKGKSISTIAGTVLKLMGIELPANFDEAIF